jgi:hypothetical protein
MSLKDLLTPTKGGDPATVAAIERKIAEAQELVVTSQREANVSALEAESGDGTAIKRAKVAHNVLMDAQTRLTSLSGALHEARERQQTRVDADAEAVRLKAWKETTRLATQRRKLAIDLQVAIENLDTTFKEFLEVNAKQVVACPDLKGAKAGTAVPDLLGAFRLYFVKQGMGWAQPGWIWGPDSIKPLVQTIEDSNALMLANQGRFKNKDVAA